MTQREPIRPRPGSHIWRRTDGEFTSIRISASGAGWIDKFPGVTPEELMWAESQHPGGHAVANNDDEWWPVEKILNVLGELEGDDPAVVLGPYKPPFGEWEEIAEWTPKS